VERADVVVLQVDLDEGLPVVVHLVQLRAVVHVAGEVEVGLGAELRQRAVHVVAVALEHQAVPALHLVVVEVQAGIRREVRRAQQRAGLRALAGAVGPAM
jgi:hypothetical protein